MNLKHLGPLVGLLAVCSLRPALAEPAAPSTILNAGATAQVEAVAGPAPVAAPPAATVSTSSPTDPATAPPDSAAAETIRSHLVPLAEEAGAVTAATTETAPAAGSSEPGAPDPDGHAATGGEPPAAGDPKNDAGAAHAAPKDEAKAPAPLPEPTLVADINLSTQRMTVTENGVTKYTWAISSARQGYRTPTGTFKPTWMSRMWYSRQYDYAPMPHAVFFSGGTAVHATYATRQLGSPASHGCVRLAPKNAATFYKLVGNHGKDMTRIVVHGSPNHGPAIAERGSRSSRYASAQRYRDYGGYRAYGPRYVTPERYYRPRRYVQRYYYSPY